MENYIAKLEEELKKNEKFIVLDDISAYVYEENYAEEDEDDNFGWVISSYTPDTDCIYEIYNYLKDNNYKIFKIIYETEGFNEKIDYFNFDYNDIRRLNKYVRNSNPDVFVTFKYDSYEAEFDDFLLMIDCLKWYRSLLTEGDLTPFEKLIYAYDIAKTFKYTDFESPEDIGKANTLHLIIKTGNIVCGGYNSLVKGILDGIDDNLVYDDFLTYCYEGSREVGAHSRGIVKIDDDTYDIHGIFICDPTWDSVNEDSKVIYGDSCDALSGYRYFMVPISKYRRFFKNDTYPRFFDGDLLGYEKRLTAKKLNEMQNDPNIVDRELKNMAGIEYYWLQKIYKSVGTYKEFIKYLNCKRPSCEDFMDAIMYVRSHQGYDNDTIEGTVIYGIDTDDKNMGFVIQSPDTKEKKLVL